MGGLTYKQNAMLKAIAQRDWMAGELNAGHSRTVNSLINRGMLEINHRGNIRWISITPEGQKRVLP